MEKEELHNDTFLAKWLAEELSNEELKSLVSKQDYLAYLKLKKAFDVSDQLDRPVDASFLAIKEKINAKKTKVIPLKTKWTLGIAASILVIFTLFNFLNPSQQIISADFGEQISFELEDGSEVILNSKSTISFSTEAWENNRELSLEGEAYFKVAKGKTFTVNTPNGKVEVLGTQFDVNSTADFFDVTCFEGKVKVTTNDNKEHLLLPGFTVRKINGFETQNLNSVEKEPSWISGESTFKSVPLLYVIQAMENEFDISIESKTVDTSILYTGAFPHDNLSIAMQTVFGSLNIKYDINSKSNIKLSNSK